MTFCSKEGDLENASFLCMGSQKCHFVVYVGRLENVIFCIGGLEITISVVEGVSKIGKISRLSALQLGISTPVM